MPTLARAIEGIPVILQAERDSVFPTPERDQRYQDRTTGDVYRYDGATWALDFAGSNGAVYDIRGHGDVSSAAAAALQAAIDAAPNGAVILIPPGDYTFSGTTPTIAGRTDLTFIAYGATITLSGTDRMALKFSTGVNRRIRWYGGRIVGSGVLADNHQALGTVINPAGVQCHDVIVSDLVFEDVVRGVYFDVSDAFGDASDITYRRLRGTNMVGTASGTGYGLVLSGVWGATLEDCRVDQAHRHAFYISVCDGVQFSRLHAEDHAGTTECVLFARSRNIVGENILVKRSAGPCVNIEPDEATTTRDTGSIQIRNITCVDTASGVQDVMIGNSAPATSSLLYNVTVDGVHSVRLSTATASSVESVRVRHGTNIIVRNVTYYASAAFTVDPVVVYVAADGGASYTDLVTVEGVRGWAPNVGGHYLTGVLVASALCTGTNRLTFRDNAVKGGAGRGVSYLTSVTNPNIEATGNRAQGPLTGTAVLVAGTKTVTSAEVLTGDRIRVTRTTTGGTVGHLSVGTITQGTSFVINSSSGTDTSTVLWEILH